MSLSGRITEVNLKELSDSDKIWAVNCRPRDSVIYKKFIEGVDVISIFNQVFI
jgi:hypothetical protein